MTEREGKVGVRLDMGLLVGGAVLAVVCGISAVVTAVQWWDGPPDCATPSDPTCGVVTDIHPGPFLVLAVCLFALGAVLVWLAVRSRPKSR